MVGYSLSIFKLFNYSNLRGDSMKPKLTNALTGQVNLRSITSELIPKGLGSHRWHIR